MMSPDEIGLSLLFCGIVLLIYQVWFWPRVAAWLGPVKCFRNFLWLLIAGVLVLPLASVFAAMGMVEMEWIMVMLAMALKIIGTATAFTSIQILVSNAASRKERGWVNGMSQSCASLMRTGGPIIGGSLWSLSVQLSQYPFHQFLLFGVTALMGLGLYLWSACLPESLNHQKE